MGKITGGIEDLVRRLGVEVSAPATIPFDPGYDARTVESHLEQSAHLMKRLKLSMASWLIADEQATAKKIRAASRRGVAVTAGGGPFEIAAASGQLEPYLELCADLGFAGIEAGEGFTNLCVDPDTVIALAADRGLEVQFEVGKKHDGPFTLETVERHIETGRRWLDAGACRIVIEARESASGVGLFAADGTLHAASADRFAEAFGLETVCFEAPTKASQFALLDHFGPETLLGNVRLEELLRVEIYRRHLHADSFQAPALHTSP